MQEKNNKNILCSIFFFYNQHNQFTLTHPMGDNSIYNLRNGCEICRQVLITYYIIIYCVLTLLESHYTNFSTEIYRTGLGFKGGISLNRDTQL